MTHSKWLPTQFHRNMYGLFMMLLHVLALSVLYLSVKLLVKDLSSNIVVFCYKLSLLVVSFLLCIPKGIKSLHTNRVGLHFIRAFFSICGSLCLFYAIKHISLADISAIQYMEHIVLLIIGIVYFGEKCSKTKIGVIVFSFIGALMVIRSDLVLYAIGESDKINSTEAGFNPYFMFVFAALSFWAMNSTLVKVLGRTEKTNTQVFYTTLFSCLISFPVAFMHWVPAGELLGLEIRYPSALLTFEETKLNWDHSLPLLFLGLLYFIHSISHFQALKYADLSLVVPLEYTRLLFAGILGYIFLNEVPSGVHYIGYSIIIGAGVFLVLSERRRYLRRRAKEQIQEEFNQA